MSSFFGGWRTIQIIDRNVLHVHAVPLKDYRRHELTEKCWCKPKYDEGSIIHNALDKREDYENKLLNKH